MKKLLILSLIISSAIGLSAATTDLPKNASAKWDINAGVKSTVQLPYAEVYSVPMEEVYSKDNYILWRCPAQFVKDFPAKYITGKNFNYFVYKNGKFHMTVTEMNKESVYKFFAE